MSRVSLKSARGLPEVRHRTYNSNADSLAHVGCSTMDLEALLITCPHNHLGEDGDYGGSARHVSKSTLPVNHPDNIVRRCSLAPDLESWRHVSGSEPSKSLLMRKDIGMILRGLTRRISTRGEYPDDDLPRPEITQPMLQSGISGSPTTMETERSVNVRGLTASRSKPCCCSKASAKESSSMLLPFSGLLELTCHFKNGHIGPIPSSSLLFSSPSFVLPAPLLPFPSVPTMSLHACAPNRDMAIRGIEASALQAACSTGTSTGPVPGGTASIKDRSAAYDNEGPGHEQKCSRRRKLHNKEAVAYLQRWLHANMNYPYPSLPLKRALAHGSGLTEAQVDTWFNNARKRLLKARKPDRGVREYL